MAICPIIVHFSTWRARSMHDVAFGFARAAVRSKDAQKQLVRTSLTRELKHQAPVVRKVDNAIQRINHYPVDSVVCFVNTYPLDSDLSAG